MNIAKILEEYNIECDSYKEEKLQGYMEKLLKWNESINLTAIKDEEEFVIKHYADSLAVLDLVEYEDAEKIIDLGTGGGFPGIPLAIFSPEKKFTLVDSLGKRLKVIDDIAGELGIKNIKTVHGRAEDLGQDSKYREKFDLCVSRAVAELSTLCEYCLPFVKTEGYFIAYKSMEIREELENAESAAELLGGELEAVYETETDHSLVIIRKLMKTPKSYPRRAGTPSKKPLK